MSHNHEITPEDLFSSGIERIQGFCGQGFGRSQIATELMRRSYPLIAELIIDPCGLNPPDSGRTTMVPQIIELVQERCKVDITGRKPRLAEASMFDKNTLAIAFVDKSADIHDFVLNGSAGVLIGLLSDFGANDNDIEKHADLVATQIAQYSWLIGFALRNLDKIVNKPRDNKGSAVPMEITEFLPRNMSYEEASLHFALGLDQNMVADMRDDYLTKGGNNSIKYIRPFYRRNW